MYLLAGLALPATWPVPAQESLAHPARASASSQSANAASSQSVSAASSQSTKTASAKSKNVASSKASGKTSVWARGRVYGEPFAVKTALYGEGYLFLRSQFMPAPTELNGENRADACTGVSIALPAGQALEGSTIVVHLTDAKESRPKLVLYVVTERGAVEGKIFQKVKTISPYSMVLKFFKRTKGLLPGYVELTCSDAPNQITSIKGFFYAQPGTGSAVKPSTL